MGYPTQVGSGVIQTVSIYMVHLWFTIRVIDENNGN